MLACLAGQKAQMNQELGEWNRVNHIEGAQDVVSKTVANADKRATKKRQKDLDERKLKRYNARIALRLVYHGESASSVHMMETEDGVYLSKLMPAVAERLGLSGKAKLLWLEKGGETVPLTSQRDFDNFVNEAWCTQPWELHVHEEKAPPKLELHEQAKALFHRFDTDSSGKIERRELRRMLLELDLSRLHISEKLVDRFVAGEFNKIDIDASGGITLNEFTEYITTMTRWMRDELMQQAHHKAVFATLAARSIETSVPPAAVPPPDESGVSVVKAPKFDIRVEVPAGALDGVSVGGGSDGADAPPQLGLSSMAPMRVNWLSEAEERPRNEFAFSPVVRIDYPTAAAGSEPQPTKFAKPLTLVMPHCFCPADGRESTVMLGARHGESSWTAPV